MEESLLREQNYQLKNEITDLKNAFDLNRDILKLVSNYSQHTDPQMRLLMQIISRLTTVNNQAMINGIEHIHQKNILKKENLRLNMELNALSDKLQRQIRNNEVCSSPNESKMVMQEQFNSLSKELMAANEERIIKQQEIEYWKERYQSLLSSQSREGGCREQMQQEVQGLREKIKRRYTSNAVFKMQVLYRELQRQNSRLKFYISELQNRLLIFIKAYQLEDQVISNGEEMRRELEMNQIPKDYQEEREQVRLLKYALNDIHVEKKEDEFILTITQRFKEKDTMNNQYFREKRSSSWPKYAVAPESSADSRQKIRTKMQEQRQSRTKMQEEERQF